MTAGIAEARSTSRKVCVLAKVALAALLIMYAIQLRSPLRLNTDAAVILRLTANLTDGKPYLTHGSRPIYPIGVPLTYSVMERAGAANALGFGFFNLVCICFAAVATFVIGTRLKLSNAACVGIVLISFSNFVLIKHSLIPLTDIPFLMLSLTCCALLETYAKKENAGRLLILMLAAVCITAAIFTRRIGIALIPAALYGIWIDSRKTLLPMIPPQAAATRILLAAGSLFLIFAIISVRHLIYIPDFRIGGSIKEEIFNQLSFRLCDFGQLLLNAPVPATRRLLPALYMAGALLLTLIAIGFWRARHQLTATHVYFLTYLCIMAVWPFGDARFWIPVLPLIALLVLNAIAPLNRSAVAAYLLIAYLAAYACLSLASIAYTTRISYAGNRFAQVYGSSATRIAYERATAGEACDPTDDLGFAIRRYGMIARPK